MTQLNNLSVGKNGQFLFVNFARLFTDASRWDKSLPDVEGVVQEVADHLIFNSPKEREWFIRFVRGVCRLYPLFPNAFPRRYATRTGKFLRRRSLVYYNLRTPQQKVFNQLYDFARTMDYHGNLAERCMDLADEILRTETHDPKWTPKEAMAALAKELSNALPQEWRRRWEMIDNLIAVAFDDKRRGGRCWRDSVKRRRRLPRIPTEIPNLVTDELFKECAFPEWIEPTTPPSG